MRRRKAKVNWFPTTGTEFGDAGPLLSTLFDSVGEVDADRSTNVMSVRAITIDRTHTVTPGGADTLADVVSGSEWCVNRIVGNIFVDVAMGAGGSTFNSSDPTVQWPRCKVDAGIFVARESQESPGAPDLFEEEYTPDNMNNIMDPWLFRRSWIIGNPRYTGLQTSASTGDPQPFQLQVTSNYANAAGACMYEGPFIDVKSKRRIQREHRLWLVVSARGWSPLPTIAVTGVARPTVSYTAELRVLGGLRRPTKRRSF